MLIERLGHVVELMLSFLETMFKENAWWMS